MLRRLQLTYLSLLAAVLLGLAIPLCVSIAARATDGVYLDRASDTARFASLADTALATGRSPALQHELTEYDELFDIPVEIVDREGRPVIRSRATPDLEAPTVRQAVRRSLSGDRTLGSATVWPWTTHGMAVVEPIARGGEIVGAAVTLSPTGQLRRTIAYRWCLLFAVCLFVLAVGFLAGGPVARWVVTPVRHLAAGTRAISAGDVGARVASTSGPPELRSLAESFNTMADRICELLARQRMVVSYAGHQLRNPLAAIRLRIENLADSAPPEELPRYQPALAEVDRLARICDSLIAMAKADSEVDRVRVDVGTVLRERTQAWLPVADARRVALSADAKSGLGALAACSTLDQVLDTLIDNAIKFSQPGVSIGVLARRDGNAVVVEVVDDGPGLPEGMLAQAVTPLWRRGDTGQCPGSGLGLAIALTLLQRSRATLALSSVDPHGLRATIRLEAAP